MTAVDSDVCVVGAGPVGLFSVFACGQLGMRCAVIDALADPGGQLVALYPEKPIYDIPGRAEIHAGGLVDDLLAQAAPYAPEYLLGHTAADLTQDADGVFTISTDRGAEIRCRAVLIAAGVGAFRPKRPPLAGVDAYEDVSVFYHVARLERFRGARVVIAGGGDSAVDWALSLAEVAASVTVVHRRETFRAHPDSVARMKADPRIALKAPFQLAGLEGDGDALSAVRVGRIGGGEERLEADALVALFGLEGDLSALDAWGVAPRKKTIPVDRATCETARAGVFAVGDVADYPGKLKLILTGFSDAAMAARAAFPRVFPDRALRFEHSTSRGAPTALTA